MTTLGLVLLRLAYPAAWLLWLATLPWALLRAQVYRSRQGGHAMLGLLYRFFCRLGSHDELPVVATQERDYVLLRCSRCQVSRALVREDASAWLEAWLRRS